jgi:glycosyltransferase involved in cell wall biosynthesis
MTRLVRYFHVVWVTPPHQWSEALERWRGGPAVLREDESGLMVYTAEAWLPLFFRPRWLVKYTAAARLRRARNLLVKRGCKRVVLYVWRPTFADSLDLVQADLSCYHIDDEYSFSPHESVTSDSEVQLLRRVDQVIIHSAKLLDKKGEFNPHRALVPNGVDYNAYAGSRPEPLDLAKIPHPRIGYTGQLKRQVDWALMVELVATHPEWSFVFVGPVSPHPELRAIFDALSRQGNVHFLGAKSAQELAAYPQHFDVCLMPYVIDDYTRYIYPLKLHEYLASGTPTVGSPIPALKEFAGIVALADTPEGWSSAISEALAPLARSAAQRAARQEVARRFDWDALVGRIAGIFAARLGVEAAPPES